MLSVGVPGGGAKEEEVVSGHCRTSTGCDVLVAGSAGDGVLRESPHPRDGFGRHDAPAVVPRRRPGHKALHPQEPLAHEARRDVHVLVQLSPPPVFRDHHRHYPG